MSFPLVKLCRQDVAPEKIENLIRLHGFGKSLAGAENDLVDDPISRDLVRRGTDASANLDRMGISHHKITPRGRPQANLSPRIGDSFQIRRKL